MPGSHDVYVIEIDNEYRIRPAVTAVRAGRRLKIRNCLDKDIVCVFSPDAVRRTGAVQVVTNRRNEVVAVATDIAAHNGAGMSLKKTADGVYPYRVLVVKSPKRWVEAVGESGPRMIVDP